MTTDLIIFIVGFVVSTSVVYSVFAKVTLEMSDVMDKTTDRK